MNNYELNRNSGTQSESTYIVKSLDGALAPKAFAYVNIKTGELLYEKDIENRSDIDKKQIRPLILAQDVVSHIAAVLDKAEEGTNTPVIEVDAITSEPEVMPIYEHSLFFELLREAQSRQEKGAPDPILTSAAARIRALVKENKSLRAPPPAANSNEEIDIAALNFIASNIQKLAKTVPLDELRAQRIEEADPLSLIQLGGVFLGEITRAVRQMKEELDVLREKQSKSDLLAEVDQEAQIASDARGLIKIKDPQPKDQIDGSKKFTP